MSMFSDAKPIAPKQTRGNAGKAYKPSDAVAGWEQYAALDAVLKRLTALLETRKQQLLTDEIEPALIARGIATGRKPDSLSPVEGAAKGSAFMRKRDTRSPLDESDVEWLDSVADAADFTETVEVTPELWAINPDYAEDGALLELVSKQLEKDKRIPHDLFMKQEGVTKVVVSEPALDNAFKLDPDKVDLKMVLRLIAGVTLRPVYAEEIATAWELIAPLLPEAEAALAAKPKNNGHAPTNGSVKEMLVASEKATRKPTAPRNRKQ